MNDYNWKKDLLVKCHDHDDIFGINYEITIKEMTKYLSKLEQFGCTNIRIMDYSTIQLELPAPVDSDEALLYILTSGLTPNECSFSKKKNVLTLSWDY